MRTLHFKVPQGNQPTYLRIAQGIREAMLRGQLKPGERMPSTRELSKTVGVHRNTVIAALNELIAEGWIGGQERRAFRVSDPLPTKYFLAGTGAGHGRQTKRARDWKDLQRIELDAFAPQTPLRWNFQSGLPDLRLFPHDEFRAHVADTLRKPKPGILDYGAPRGHPSLVDSLAAYLRRLRGLTNREILVTNGSQEGVYLLARLLLRPGDYVAMEELGYPPARETYRVAGAKVLGVRSDSDGIDVDAFARLARRHPIKLLFLTPLHQFPTTVTLSTARRVGLYEICSRHDIVIFEDDYDHEFHYASQPLPPIASHDPDGRVVYAGTFSKVLFPSARLGFLAVPPALLNPITQYRRITTHQNDAVIQDAIARWMNSGGLERHLRRMRRHYAARREAMTSALQQARADGARLDWKTPDGGMALWLETHRNSSEVARRALALGVFVSPERNYRLTPDQPGTHLRLGFSNQNPAELAAGIERLGSILRGA